MYILHNPKKKATSYVAKITNEYGKPIRLKIPYCKIQYLREQPSNGHLLRIILDKDTEQYNKVIQIDNTISATAISNNNKWFNNNLDIEQIKEFYRPSLNIDQDTMTILISDIQDTVILLNDVVIDNIDNIDFTHKNLYLSLEIEAQGLYFFPKKFGIRWIVNKIAIYTGENLNNDTEDIIDRESIEEEWEQEVSIIKELIEKDINILNEKIKKLSEYSNNIESTLIYSKKEKSTEKWNEQLIELSHKVAKYYSNRI